MHRAKTFWYASLGILALALAFHLGARSARASYVPPGETGIVGHSQMDGNEVYVLLDNGEIWENRMSGGWQQFPYPVFTLPVPVSDVKFWNGSGNAASIVTRDNQVFRFNPLGGEYGSWDNLGAPPGLTATEPSTWGRVKARFGSEGY